jgi:hypothetical protein
VHLLKIGLALATQTSGFNSIGPSVAWSPSYEVAPDLAIEGQLGLALFSTDLGGDFVAIDYQVRSGYAFAPGFTAEAGLGCQFWTGAGGNANSPEISLGGTWAPPSGGISRLFVDLSYVMVKALPTTMLTAGIEI